MESKTITLVSKEGTEIELTEEQAFKSEYIKVLHDGDKTVTKFNVNVYARSIHKMLDFMALYSGIKYKEIERPLKKTDGKYDPEYILRNPASPTIGKDVYALLEFTDDEQFDEFFDLLRDINKLDYKDFFDVCCARMGMFIGNNLGDETKMNKVRELMHQPDDLTAEDKERIKEENKWADDT